MRAAQKAHTAPWSVSPNWLAPDGYFLSKKLETTNRVIVVLIVIVAIAIIGVQIPRIVTVVLGRRPNKTETVVTVV